MGNDVIVLPTPADVAEEAARRFVESGRRVIAARDRFSVALSGGSTPASFHRTLAGVPWREKIPWANVHLFWGDERCVPPDHPDSNFGAAYGDLLAHVPVPESNVHPMRGEIDSTEGANDYERELIESLDSVNPQIDLVFLGLGADGHTASLFPGSPALAEMTRLAVDTLRPEDGSRRLTLTLAALNAARQVIFLVTGGGKIDILSRVLHASATDDGLPAQQVSPRDGTLIWLVDEAAGGGLID